MVCKVGSGIEPLFPERKLKTLNLGHVFVGANIGLIFEKFLVGDANLNYFVCLLFIYQVQEVQKSRAFPPMATTTIAIL